jgi:hypothetical protein
MTATTNPSVSERIPVDEHAPPTLPETVGDSAKTLSAYVKQETLGPLKGLGSRAGLAIGGGIAIGIAAIELLLVLLRVLQTETGDSFTGSASWAPYAITLAVAAAGCVVLLQLIKRSGATEPDIDPTEATP